MKYIFLLVGWLYSLPSALLAHDGSGHVETAWYQEVSVLTILISLGLLGVILAGAWYYLPQYRKVCAGIGMISILLGLVTLEMNQPAPTPVSGVVASSLASVSVTVYRTEGCSCCGAFAKELSTTGAAVTVETITETEMRDLKNQHGIAPAQQSCHTSLIDGYVVEGHVPFEAIAKLVTERPDTTGITLPGMPIGTPGMPGKQTEVYTVNTLEKDLFWQSSNHTN